MYNRFESKPFELLKFHGTAINSFSFNLKISILLTCMLDGLLILKGEVILLITIENGMVRVSLMRGFILLPR